MNVSPLDAERRRWARAADLPRLVALICEAYAVERTFVRGPRTNLQELEEHAARGRFMLLELREEILATVYLERRRPTGAATGTPAASPAPWVGYFGMLAVAAVAQGRGLGRRMVEAAEDWSLGQGLEVQEIWTVNLRAPLIAWYQRLGYRPVATAPFDAPHRQRRPCHFVVLHKQLRSA